MNAVESGQTKDVAPRFCSIAFHTRYFPALLWSRLRPRKRTGTTFVPTEFYIAFMICVVLVVVGLPGAINKHFIIGWVVSCTGFVGMLALFVSSIWSRKRAPDYAGFLFGVFFSFVMLGLSAGIFAGALEHSLGLGLLGSLAGLVLGYVVGICAGLWFQYLGWIAVWLDILAGLAIIGMIVVDLMLLFG
jgi:hypothetical protein